jgi:hypothetical protein
MSEPFDRAIYTVVTEEEPEPYNDLSPWFQQFLVRPGTRTWTYTPEPSWSVTMPAPQAWRTLWWMLRQLIRHPRTALTIESGFDPPYTVDVDDIGP